MKHNDIFYESLKNNKSVFEGLIRCCQTEDMNVRKSGIFAIGNSVCHSEALHPWIEEALSDLVGLLNDALAKTRFHAIAVIGNLVNYKFTERMVELKIAQRLVEIACGDSQFGVQESALNVVGLMCKHEKGRKVSNI